MKLISLFLFIFLSISCVSYQDNSTDFAEVNQLREEKKYMDTISILKSIIESNKSSKEDVSKSHFIIADILLNDFRNYQLAIIEFNKVIDISINNDYRKKSLFMVGYIYHNNLQQFTDALYVYEQFKSEYPSDELIASVDYEINLINKILE